MDDIRYSAPTIPAFDSLGADPAARLGIHQSNAVSSDVRGQILAAGCNGSAEPFEPDAVRYIKLGENGTWATNALEQGIIPFGYRSVDHGLCLAGNWDEVRHQLAGMGRTARGVSQGLRELKDFYGLPGNTLWVTMAAGHFLVGLRGRSRRRDRAGQFG
jgi:hypothetical protein